MLKLILNNLPVTKDIIEHKGDLNTLDKFCCFNKKGPTYFSYICGILKINFSIEDIGDCINLKIYKDTDYTKTVDEKDILDFFYKEILLEDPNTIFAGFNKTKTIKSDIDKKKLNYSEIYQVSCYRNKNKRLLFGKSSLVNKKQEITIEYDIWNSLPECGWYWGGNIKYIILNEPDPKIREIKSEIVKKYYSINYEYGS